MPSSFSWNPSPRGGRSLAELLEKQQEPFLLEVYLIENGCSRRLISSQSKPFCWPLNLCKRLRIRLSSHGGTVALFLKHTLAKLIYSDNATSEHRRLSFSSCLSEKSKHQLSSMSAVELHSAETSPFHNHSRKINDFSSITDECRSKPRNDSVLNRAYITFEVVHDNSKPPMYAEKTNMFSNGRIRIRHALDCITLKAKEKLRSIDGISSSADQMIKKASMNELILSLERHKGDINNLASEFSNLEEWNQFKRPQIRVVGLLIEAAIFDDLREEAVLDMFVLH